MKISFKNEVVVYLNPEYNIFLYNLKVEKSCVLLPSVEELVLSF